jgi:hypothetical protein
LNGITVLGITTLQRLVIRQYIFSSQTLWWIGANVIVSGFVGSIVRFNMWADLVPLLVWFFITVTLGPILIWKFRKPISGKA